MLKLHEITETGYVYGSLVRCAPDSEDDIHHKKHKKTQKEKRLKTKSYTDTVGELNL